MFLALMSSRRPKTLLAPERKPLPTAVQEKSSLVLVLVKPFLAKQIIIQSFDLPAFHILS